MTIKLYYIYDNVHLITTFFYMICGKNARDREFNTKRKKNIITTAAAPTKIEMVGDNFKAINPDKVNETSFVP
jgi:hypothetical protein